MSALYGEPVSVCEWPVDLTCLPDLPTVSDPPEPGEEAALVEAQERRANAVEAAEQVLWALSGRQFGCVEVTARPCPTYAQGFGYRPWMSVLDGGYWGDVGCGCLGSCSVSGPRVIHLPGPVHSIVEVVIADIGLTDDDYQLEGDALYRTSGASWPSQNLGAPLGEPGTWSVTYTQGIAPPRAVAKLTGTLARELIAACDDDMECRIPRNVVSASRRGVSYEFDPSKLVDAGKTGLEEVDMWLASVNPNRLMSAPEVL